MKLFFLFLFLFLGTITSLVGKTYGQLPQQIHDPIDKGMCEDFVKIHEYMGKRVPAYAKCFNSHFFTQSLARVCSKECLDPTIRASQLVQKECLKEGLTAKENGAHYKKFSYRPWSSRRGAEASCSTKEEKSICMDKVQKAETLITNAMAKSGSPAYSSQDLKAVCGPCIGTLYTLYSENPNDLPVIYSHALSDPEKLFGEIKRICRY